MPATLPARPAHDALERRQAVEGEQPRAARPASANGTSSLAPPCEISRVVTNSVPSTPSSSAEQTSSTRGIRRRSPGWLTISWAMIAKTSIGLSKARPTSWPRRQATVPPSCSPVISSRSSRSPELDRLIDMEDGAAGADLADRADPAHAAVGQRARPQRAFVGFLGGIRRRNVAGQGIDRSPRSCPSSRAEFLPPPGPRIFVAGGLRIANRARSATGAASARQAFAPARRISMDAGGNRPDSAAGDAALVRSQHQQLPGPDPVHPGRLRRAARRWRARHGVRGDFEHLAGQPRRAAGRGLGERPCGRGVHHRRFGDQPFAAQERELEAVPPDRHPRA